MIGFSEERLNAAWSRLHKERLGWAVAAHSEFVRGLSDEIRSQLATGDESGEAFVVLYGCSQVGKTTLILELMGVAPECLPLVSRVLRGGRAAGQSATATAMQYQRSPNDRWAIDRGEGRTELESSQAATDALADVRSAMNAGQLVPGVPVTLWIPACAFSSDTGDMGRTRILDLPGYNPDEAREREHVAAVAKRFVEQADLILLVGRGDDLGFLQPEKLALPGIEDWQVVPGRFRVVTTFSYTPDSVQKQVPPEGEVTPALFRRLLRDQIATHQIALTERAGELTRFFPLEFGDSWSGRGEGDPLRRRLGPVIDQLRSELARDIRQAASPFQRLRTALDVHVVAQDYRRSKEGEARKLLEQLGRQINELAQDLDALRLGRFQARESLVSSREWERGVSKEVIEADLERIETVSTEKHLEKAEKVPTNTDGFRQVIHQVERACVDAIQSTRPQGGTASPLQEFWRGVRPDLLNSAKTLQEKIRMEFRPLSQRLDGYKLREYYPRLSSDFAEDKKKLRGGIFESAGITDQAIRAVWRSAAEQRLKDEKKTQVALRSRIRGFAPDIKRAKRKWLQRVDDKRRAQDDWCALQKRIATDEDSGAVLRHLLRKSYLAELRERRARIAAAASPGTSFLELLAALELKEICEKVMNERGEK